MSHLNFTQIKAATAALASDLEKLAATFLEVIPRAMKEIRVELWSHRSHELSVPQFRVLANVSQGSKTNKELAQAIGVNVTSMSRMVTYLTDRGLIEKSTGLEDRREIHVRLSKAGTAAFEAIRAKTRRGLAARLESLSTTEKKVLQEGLNILSRTLGKEEPPGVKKPLDN